MFVCAAARYQNGVKRPIQTGAGSDEPGRQSSAQDSASAIWTSVDNLYPSLTCFCTYDPPRVTITLRHTGGSEKSVSFDQPPRQAYGVSTQDRKRIVEVAILLSNQLAKELGLRPVEA